MRRLAVLLVALVVAGCSAAAPAPSVAVGAQHDPESSLLAHLYAAALRFYGSAAHVEVAPDPVRDLDSGDVDVVPGLTGALLTRFEPDAPARSAAQVYRAMVSVLPEGLAAGDYADTTSDKPLPAVTDRTAHDWAATDTLALLPRCATLRVGHTAGRPGPASLAGCVLPAAREFPDDNALFAALRAGKIDVAWTSAAAPDIPDQVSVLSDRTALVRAENVVPVYRRNTLSETQLRSINELAGVLDTDALAQMRAKVAAGQDPGAVAAAYLDVHPLGR
ncbi:glycine betaine ABC transporter substrate-binding protein [Mycobacterium sp. BMJ-28]